MKSKTCLVRIVSECYFWVIFTSAYTGTTEMVLLLLWRHLVSYVERDSSSSATEAPIINMKSTLRLLPPPDSDSFRANAGKRLIGALAKLSTLDLVRSLA
jgi:hypothetical protein